MSQVKWQKAGGQSSFRSLAEQLQLIKDALEQQAKKDQEKAEELTREALKSRG